MAHVKINLQHVTFNIPVKIDFPERQENLNIVVDYLLHHFDTNIIIFESYIDQPKCFISHPNVKHITEQYDGRIFHRTRYLNEMAVLSKTPIIVNYDCDVLFNPKQIIDAVAPCFDGTCAACFPYDGLFINAPRTHIPAIKETKNLDFIDINKTENFGKGSMGGAIVWNKKQFVRGGMENENFLSWGYEDWERVNRFMKLGFGIMRTKGALIHLSHPRGKDSSDHNPYYKHNGDEYNKIMAFSPEDLKKYILSQPWMELHT